MIGWPSVPNGYRLPTEADGSMRQREETAWDLTLSIPEATH